MGFAKYAMDWRRVSRWSLVGALVVLVWLLWPAARCSWGGFEDTTLTDVNHQRALDADPDSVVEESGFFARVYDSAAACYSDNSISAQDGRKRNLFWSLLILAIFARVIHRFTIRRRPTGY